MFFYVLIARVREFDALGRKIIRDFLINRVLMQFQVHLTRCKACENMKKSHFVLTKSACTNIFAPIFLKLHFAVTIHISEFS